MQQAREKNGIEHLQLPLRFPDLNPIEHAWDLLAKVARLVLLTLRKK